MDRAIVFTLVALFAAMSLGRAAIAAEELRGVYMELHGNRDYGCVPILKNGDWRGLFRELKALGVNAVFPCVVTPSGAVYPSKVVPVKPAEARLGQADLLRTLIDAAHAEGLEIHPWTIEWSHAPAGTDADRLVHDAAGKTEGTLCPSVEANRDLMRRMIMELVQGYDVDGVQYDYMRLPGDKHCYCRHCRAGFEKKLGRQVANWPADVAKGGALEARYVDHLCGTISSFVEEMHGLVKKAKPRMVVSCAVWSNNSSGRNTGVRQDWGLWVEKGWLDFVAPMNYGNKWIIEHYGDFARNEAKAVAGRMPLVYGLGAYQDSPQGLASAVKLGRELKCSGFIIYTLTQKSFGEHLPALAKDPWREKASVPAFGRR